MARFGGQRLLVCFYCGKRSKLRFDGSFHDFLCMHCDATNYLDENGEITDPPVATEREAPVQYAVPKPASTPIDNVFCETCLKNQRLFTASLAQYLPDDPSHPDYDELDRNYYRYRKNLEKRYPQVCDDCAVKVQQRIRQAGYTAKTDHLRRMMDRSRGRKTTSKKATPLDLANVVGRWLWRGGLLAQMLWHMVYISQALEHQDNGMYDPDDSSWSARAITVLHQSVKWLPEPDLLIRASIVAGVLSAWWNPHFVQVNRGFTRHLVGLSQWYSFQGLIVFFRILFRNILSIDAGRSWTAQLAAHAATALVMCLIYILAGRSITVDTTPLFRMDDTPMSISPAPKSPASPKSPEKRKQEDSKTFSELFSEALDSTPTQIHNDSPAASLTELNGHIGQTSSFAMQNSPIRQVQYSDEMDWSPSQPQHRAFRSQQSPPKPFSQSPTQDGNPFWYKVPAAPTNPAHKLRNAPNKPIIQQKIVTDDGFASFRPRSRMSSHKRKEAESSQDVSFKNPSFFAQDENDDANSLADLLTQSFSLKAEAQPATEPTKPSMWTVQRPGGPMPRRNLESTALLVCLPSWLIIYWLSLFKIELQSIVLVVVGAIALSGTGTGRQMEEEEEPSLSEAVLSAIGVIELAAICWVMWELWKGQIEVTAYGAAVTGVVLVHQGFKSRNMRI